MKKILSIKKLQDHLKEIRKHKTLVFTNGCFDLLHIGHIRYLKEAKALGDILIVGLNSDKSVSKLKGKERPIQCENDRAEILSALENVDYVSIFSEDTPLALIQVIQPDVLVKGGDWGKDKIVGSQFVTSYGGKVKSLSFIPGTSSTHLVKKISKLQDKRIYKNSGKKT